jgi:methionyl-tRNA formyltransferase
MINVHASLLPRWRGAAPISWAIRAGDPETGITIQQMARGMDSGAILHQLRTPIEPMETAGELTGRLARLGADALVEALALMQLGVLAPREQDRAGITRAPKLDRLLARLDWSEDAAAVARTIRALDPTPGAWTLAPGQELKLFGARPVDGGGVPGTILALAPALRVAAGSGAVEIATVQPAGKPRMDSADWGRGHGALQGAALQ